MEKRKSKSINRIFFISLIFTIFISSFSLSFALICDSEYCYIEFTSDDTWIVPDGVTQADVLLVAGGGGGAGNTAYSNAGGGAGGAGGLIFEENLTLSLSSYPITIGQGGNGVNQPNVVAQNGEDTIAFGLTALGGGGGILTAGTNNNPASNGGSGGGGRDNPAGLGLQPGSIWGGFGNNGGRNSNDLGGGGGGGAGSAAIDISGEDGGNGGDGLYFGDIYGDIYGDNGWFAGGGGGGARAGTLGTGGIGGGGDGSQPTGNIVSQNGMANTGGGGGGGSSSHAGANGGSGVVLVRFENPAASINIIEQPSDKELGQTFSPFPQVEVLGLQSFPLENILVEVSINNGSFEPSTTQVLTDINGIATFDNLIVADLGEFTLNFSVVGTNIETQSNSFEVTSSIIPPPITLPGGPFAQCDDTYELNVTGINYIVHLCTSAGQSNFYSPFGLNEIELLIVAGGGGGAGSTGNAGRGGGGAGGLIFQNYSIAENQNFTLEVGLGGTGGVASADGENGENSFFDSLIALGGGGGGNLNNNGLNGGSGGGAGVNNFGHPGGNDLQNGSTSGGFGNQGGISGPFAVGAGGGGGGAGSPGVAGNVNTGGTGGAGLLLNITGTPLWYAAGGGSSGLNGGLGGSGIGGNGSSDGSDSGTPGLVNTGSGGGGTQGASSSGIGGNGGSGIVIIRYPDVPASIELISVPVDTIQNITLNSTQVLVKGLFGTPLLGVDIQVSLNGGSFSSGTTTVTTNSFGIAEFNDLQISDIGEYNLSFEVVGSSILNIESFNFSIYSPIVPTINVFNIVDGGIYRIPEIEINFNATSLNPIDSLWYFNGTNNITFTNPINISLDVGIYTFEFFANDSFGQINSTVLTFEMVDTPIVNVSPNNGSKFFNSETIPLRFNSSFPIDNVAFYINNDSSNLTDMVTWDFEQWEYDLNINNRGIYNITFVYDVNSLIQETFNLTNILILEDAHKIITKSISNFGTDLYLIDIFVENKIPIISSFTVLDYVGFNFNSGSYTPVFDFINNFIFGRVLGWQNFTQNQSISYSITADNLNASLIRNFRIGFE